MIVDIPDRSLALWCRQLPPSSVVDMRETVPPTVTVNEDHDTGDPMHPLGFHGKEGVTGLVGADNRLLGTVPSQLRGPGIFTVITPFDTDLFRSIVAGNSANGASAVDQCAGLFFSGWSVSPSGAACGQSGSSNSNADAQLGQLRDNGGPTDTMAPGPSSPAIDLAGECQSSLGLPLILR